jgi:hypothetical protein
VKRLVLALGGLALALTVQPVAAAPQDYQFELVGRPVRVGDTIRLGVRLVRVRGGEAVAGATIVPVDFNRSPENAAASSPVMVVPAREPGVQLLEVKPEMSGRWELVLTARVPDEPEPVTGRLVLTVPP